MEPVAPTLARLVDADEHAAQSRADLTAWAKQNLPSWSGTARLESIDLIRPADTHAEIAATLLYPVTDWPFRELYELARTWSAGRRNEVIDVALRSRTRRDELQRGFRGGLYAFDIVMDIGAVSVTCTGIADASNIVRIILENWVTIRQEAMIEAAWDRSTMPRCGRHSPR